MNNKIIQSLIPSSIFVISTIFGEKIHFSEYNKSILINIAIGSLIALLSLELIPLMHLSKNFNNKIMTVLGIIFSLILFNLIKEDHEKIKKSEK